MAHSLEDFDAWKTGENDFNNPSNQVDSENEIEAVSDCLNLRFEGFEDKALDIIGELIEELNALREYANNNENVYLLKRLNSIYNKL